jgi:hypothetical protein
MRYKLQLVINSSKTHLGRSQAQMHQSGSLACTPAGGRPSSTPVHQRSDKSFVSKDISLHQVLSVIGKEST